MEISKANTNLKTNVKNGSRMVAPSRSERGGGWMELTTAGPLVMERSTTLASARQGTTSYPADRTPTEPYLQNAVPK